MEWTFWVIAGFVFLIGLLNHLLKPRMCDVCHAGFKRKYFTWEIEGKKQHLCPACNSKMERRQSNKRFKDRFG